MYAAAQLQNLILFKEVRQIIMVLACKDCSASSPFLSCCFSTAISLKAKDTASLANPILIHSLPPTSLAVSTPNTTGPGVHLSKILGGKTKILGDRRW